MKSNLFDFNHEVLLSCNQGELVPIGVTPVVPGDSIKHATSCLIRVQPQLAPVMHKVVVTMHHWFVPYRIIWDEWDNFWTGGPDGTSAPVRPYITTPASTGFGIGTLADYLGFVPEVPDVQISALPFRAYAKTYNYYYRDQNLQSELVVSTASGADTTTNTTLQHAAWERDYFTSARPEPQLGTDVTIPLTGDAPVVGDGNPFKLAGSGAGAFPNSRMISTYAAGQRLTYMEDAPTSAHTQALYADPDPDGLVGLKADLSDVSAVEMNDLRLAAALQRYKENLMRFGHRPMERLRAAFGVAPQDARNQEPEYLGGGRQVIQFSEVLQTAEGTDPVGELRGHGISAGRTNRYRRYIPEFGLVMTLMCVRPKTVYAQAVNREWLKRTKEEFLQPELTNLGQQEIWDGEAYMGAASQYGVWGYQDRYDEYRRAESRIAGEFRDTLDFWHMARIFDSEPALNGDFVKANPTDRIYAAPSADQLYVRAMHNMKIKRRLPRVAKPRLF